MHKTNKLTQLITLALVLGVSAGCSGSSSKSVKANNDTDMVSGGGGSNGNGDSGAGGSAARASSVQVLAAATGDTGEAAAATVKTLGRSISQIELAGSDAVTSGTGEVIINTGEAVERLSAGIGDGLGDLNDNDNALGTTVAGATGAVAETGEAVSAAGDTVESINTLPVFAQLDQSTGLLTQAGNTVGELGGVVTKLGDTLTVQFTKDQGHLSGLSREMTAVIRPLVNYTGGTLQHTGDALIVGSIANTILTETGTAVVQLGQTVGSSDSAVISDLGGTVEGVGYLVVATGGVLSVGEDDAASRVGLGKALSNTKQRASNGGQRLNDRLDTVVGTSKNKVLTTKETLGETTSTVVSGSKQKASGVVVKTKQTVTAVTGSVSDKLDGKQAVKGLVTHTGQKVDALSGDVLSELGEGESKSLGLDMDLHADGSKQGINLDANLGAGLKSLSSKESDGTKNDGIVDVVDDALLDPLLGGLL